MRGSFRRVGDTQASRERREGVFFRAHAPSAVTKDPAPASEPFGMEAGAVRLDVANDAEGEEGSAEMPMQAMEEGVETFSASGARAVSTAVTLIVYGWKMVEPGTLWWVFPSVAAALGAAHAMTNAVRWAIVKGPPRGAIVDIAKARAMGSVLVEQTA